jgi:ELWxxDGT repeat protein
MRGLFGWSPKSFTEKSSRTSSSRCRGEKRQSAVNSPLGVQSLEPRLALAAMPQLVENINFGSGDGSPQEFTMVGGTTFFAAWHASAGYELWKTNGTTEGTVLVKDVYAGLASSYRSGWVGVPAVGKMYFPALWKSGNTVPEDIWVSDGTESGTQNVTSFPADGLFPSNLTLVGTTLYFTRGKTLHAIDTQTQQVRSVKTFANEVGPAVAFQNKLFFRADDGKGQELYSSDGTLNGTSIVKDINTKQVNASSFPGRMTVVGNKLLFEATDGDSGFELWSSDGTTATRVADINPLGADSFPGDLKALAGKLYFSAFNGQKREAYVYDPASAAAPVQIDVNPGSGVSSDPRDFTLFAGKVYFTGIHPLKGRELFRLDGTTATVIDVAAGADSSDPLCLTVVGQSLLFSAANVAGDRELYRIDGSGVPTLVKNIWNGGSSAPDALYAVGGTVYFSASDGARGQELWKTDGTTAGTKLVRDCNDGDPFAGSDRGSFPDSFVPFDSKLFFVADADHTAVLQGRYLHSAQSGTEVKRWSIPDPQGGKPATATSIVVSTPTAVGARLFFGVSYQDAGGNDVGGWLYRLDAGAVAPVEVKRFANAVESFAAFKGRLFFNADDGGGRRLWVSDGAGDSTRAFGDPFNPPANPSDFTVFGNYMYFNAAEFGTQNWEVWRTDGVDGGVTGRFADLHTTFGSNPAGFYAYQGKLYFTANGADANGFYGRELYWTDGDQAPVLTKDIDNRAGTSSSPAWLTGFGGYVYFTASNQDHGEELWRTNGSVTDRVSDLLVGPDSSSPSYLTVVGNRLFFSADNGNWAELWATADGTTLSRVTSINANGKAWPYELVHANGRLFFSANDGERGRELWEFDVVANRERFVADIAFGAGFGNPWTSGSPVFDGHLYFSASDGVAGRELWRLPVPPLGAGRAERDFNGDGVSDVLWRDAVTGAHAVHLLNGNGAVTAGRGLGGDLGLTIAATGDFNGDGVADIVWRNAAGSHTLHLMSAAGSRTADRSLGLTGFTLEATGDYNGDGKTDIVWRNVTTGVHSMWLMNGVAPLSGANLPGVPGNLRLATTSGNYDANGDGKTDLVWRSIADGSTALWRMNGTTVSSVAGLPKAAGFALIGTGDFDGDGRGDLLWRNDKTGATSMWLMNDAAIKSAKGLGGDKGLSVVATGDYNGDGKTDLVWRNSATGMNTQWLMNGATRTSNRNLGGDARRLSIVRAPGLPVVSSGPLRARESDFNGDGISDLVWRDSTTGQHAIHILDSRGEVAEGRGIGGDLNLSIVVMGDFNGDGVSDRIWRTGSVATGTHTVHLLRANGSTLQGRSLGLSGFTIAASGDYNGDGRTDLMWRSATGVHSIWLMNGVSPSSTAIVTIPVGWQVFGLSGNYDANGDGKDDVLLRRSSDGTTVLWRMNGTQVAAVSQLTGAMAFTLAGVGDFDGDGRGDLIWRNNSTGRTSMWLMNDNKVKSTHLLGGDLTLQVVVTGDYNGDGRTDLVWRNATTGANTMWLMDGPSRLTDRPIGGSKTLALLSAAGKR